MLWRKIFFFHFIFDFIFFLTFKRFFNYWHSYKPNFLIKIKKNEKKKKRKNTLIGFRKGQF